MATRISTGAFASPFIFALLYGIGWIIWLCMDDDLGVLVSRMYENKYILLWGIINFGANSVIYLLFRGARKLSAGGDSSDRSSGSSFAMLISLIGLLSASLGIVCFFWDHFRSIEMMS